MGRFVAVGGSLGFGGADRPQFCFFVERVLRAQRLAPRPERLLTDFA